MTDRTRRWLIRGGVAVVLLVALVYGAIFFYANVLNDSPDEFDERGPDGGGQRHPTRLRRRPRHCGGDSLGVTATAAHVGRPTSTAAGTTAPATTRRHRRRHAATEARRSRFDGTWQVTTASEFGYRVEEVLGGVNTTAVGRGSEIDGSLDDRRASRHEPPTSRSTSRRSRATRAAATTSSAGGSWRPTSSPTATFSSPSPIDFGAVPAVGEQVTAHRHRRSHAPRRHPVGDLRRDGRGGAGPDRRTRLDPGPVLRLRDRQPVGRRRGHHRGQRPARVRPRLRTAA